MPLQELWRRFQRDLTANWKKTAALGVLFAFGCCFWIPMLTRAASPKRSVGTTSIEPTSEPAGATAPAPQTADSSAKKDLFWSSLTRSLADDPLFRSADADAWTRDPFALDEDQFPLPVLFAEDRSQDVEAAPIVVKDVAPTGLELRSTIIGRTRRAAMINGQLFQIGKEIVANGRTFQLTAIESHRVVLTSGEQNYELKLARPKLMDVLHRDRAADLSDPRPQ